MHEMFSHHKIDLVYERSEFMAADIFTKAFTNREKWDHALKLTNVVDPKEIAQAMAKQEASLATSNISGAPGVHCGSEGPEASSVPIAANKPLVNDIKTCIDGQLSAGRAIPSEVYLTPTSIDHNSSVAAIPHDYCGERARSDTILHFEQNKNVFKCLDIVKNYNDLSQFPERRFTEVCAGPQSALCTKADWTTNCDLVRITAKEDLRKRETVNYIISRLEGPNDAVWFALPCTGGSTLTYVNWSKGNETTRDKIREHRRVFWQLWAMASKIIKHAVKVNALVCFEWPKDCMYWKYHDVQALFFGFGFVSCRRDGCCDGMVSVNKKTLGLPLLKPWRIVSNSRVLCHSMQARCNKSHQHARVQGQDTKLSESYKPSFAFDFHCGFVLNVLLKTERFDALRGLSRNVPSSEAQNNMSSGHVFECAVGVTVAPLFPLSMGRWV